MQTFRYRGRDRGGNLREGTIDAASARDVMLHLRNQGIQPVEIAPAYGGGQDLPVWLADLMGQNRVTPADLLNFTRQIGVMVRSGLPLMQVIDGLRRGTPSRALARVLQEVRASLDRGADLASALARHPKVFDAYYISMVRVGENTGRLPDAFAGLQRQLDFNQQTRRKVNSATRYPLIVIGAIAVAMAILSVFVIPIFAKTFLSMKVELPLLTRAILAVSDLVRNAWWALLLGGAGGYLLLGRYLATPSGRLARDRWLLSLPLIGSIQRKAAILRFCEGFATAIKSGVPIASAMELSAGVVDNAFFAGKILQMRTELERGQSVSRAATLSQIFMPLELQMITVGDETGYLDQMLEELVGIYRADIEYEVGRLGQSIEPILLGVMGLLVGLLILGVFMPLWGLTDAITNTGKR